ncbi:MAG: FmdB family zinc ribbon protein [Fimbriimonadaceae bacterium]
MPIYVYEHLDGDCEMGLSRLELFQKPGAEALNQCPYCGEPVKRVVGSVSIKTRPKLTYNRAAQQGLTTFKRTRWGEYQKIAGPGVDGIIATDEDKVAVEQERRAPKKLDLDK